MFSGVSVVVNAIDPERGALAHANEWASRLHLPLRAVEWPSRTQDSSELRWAPTTSSQLEACAQGRTQAASAASPTTLQALSATCGRSGVAWDACVWQGSRSVGAQQVFRPFDLCVFGAALSAAVKETLYSRSLQSPQASVMVCPQTWRPAPRVLVLNQHRRPDEGFLDTVAAVCKAFQATPVLLTTARTEREARSRERIVEEAFARRGLTVDFDYVAGCDVPTAVARAARWRRCSHVFVERSSTSLWRRWLFGDIMRELADLSESLALVAIPAAQLPSLLGGDARPSCGRPNETTEIERGADGAVSRA